MIVLKNVCKTLAGKEVLKDVSFHIAHNESVGIIGLNGAGKTMLLDTMAGMIKPDSGFIRINGQESLIGESRFCRDLTYVSGTRTQLWESVRVQASFDSCIEMYQTDKRTAAARLAKLTRIFAIEEFLKQEPRSLSLGERMRCELVYAFLPAPPLIMLDEVLLGLDVSVRHKILRYLEAYKREKRSTILYTSNCLSEVELLCDRVLLIDAGRIIFDGNTRHIMEIISPLYRMEVRTASPLPDFEDLPLERYCIDGERITIEYDKQKLETAQLLRYLMERCEIKNVRLFEPDLEEAIRKIYGGNGWKR